MKRSASSAASACWSARTPSSAARCTTRRRWPAPRRRSSRTAARWQGRKDEKYTLQVAPEDCTGCRLCVEVCPVKNKSEVRLKAINMQPQAPLREQERENWDFFLKHRRTPDRQAVRHDSVKDVQLLEPLFEFSGACAGCGETPYLKLLSQLFGDRALIANATGCSSIYGGNLPTTPWTTNRDGRGPAWSNSLFEDNAEFGLGMRLALDKQAEYAAELVRRLSVRVGDELTRGLLEADQSTEAGIDEQRERVRRLRERLQGRGRAGGPRPAGPGRHAGEEERLDRRRRRLGLRHRLRRPGPRAGVRAATSTCWCWTRRFTPTREGRCRNRRRAGRWPSSRRPASTAAKKDLALIAMSHGAAYVARVAMGANDAHTLNVFREAEAFDGPSLILAYSHCIAHGYDMAHGMEQQKLGRPVGLLAAAALQPGAAARRARTR